MEIKVVIWETHLLYLFIHTESEHKSIITCSFQLYVFSDIQYQWCFKRYLWIDYILRGIKFLVQSSVGFSCNNFDCDSYGLRTLDITYISIYTKLHPPEKGFLKMHYKLFYINIHKLLLYGRNVSSWFTVLQNKWSADLQDYSRFTFYDSVINYIFHRKGPKWVCSGSTTYYCQLVFLRCISSGNE